MSERMRRPNRGSLLLETVETSPNALRGEVSRQTSRERAPGLQQRASKQTRAGVFWRPRRGRATIVKSLRGSAVCPARDS
ncbi:hypothetical protein XAB3213_4450022 [Xanthomonas citri pv. bilvae]|nr:hypothetical protein XAB3213_4450022 [Xanthomonas citri pv. bilvae]